MRWCRPTRALAGKVADFPVRKRESKTGVPMPGRIDIPFKWFDHGRGLELPQQQTSGAAGLDLRAALPDDETLTIGPGRRAMVPCGFAIALPEGFEAQVRPRSGLAAKY